jgi:hypothetical protein
MDNAEVTEMSRAEVMAAADLALRVLTDVPVRDDSREEVVTMCKAACKLLTVVFENAAHPVSVVIPAEAYQTPNEPQ